MTARKILARFIVALALLTTPLGAQEPVVRIDGGMFERPSADIRAMSASLDKIPSGPIFLFLKLRNARGPDALGRLEIDINNTAVAQGTSAASGFFWKFRRFPLPSNCLRPGRNTIRVKSSKAAAPPRTGRS